LDEKKEVVVKGDPFLKLPGDYSVVSLELNPKERKKISLGFFREITN
jgi:hypothetical protein